MILNCDKLSLLSNEILNYFDFRLVKTSIDQTIEHCYRNVDLNKLTGHILGLNEGLQKKIKQILL